MKIGEYIRTCQGDIGKVATVTSTGIIIEDERHIHFDGITKHSPNIIDLIEVGDILEIEEDGIKGCVGWDKETTTLSYKDMIEDIKKGDVKLLGIVTHQQFNSIKYEV